MRRAFLPLFGLACFLGLLLVLYRAVLFEDGQFAYRDSGFFYYPLYLRVQQEWDAGRWPLWDPGQNGGEPLLGNPMAAVLYPRQSPVCLAAIRLGGSVLRDRAYGHRLFRAVGPGPVVRRELGRGVPGRVELRVRSACVIPL